MLRSRESRREESLGEHFVDPIARREDGIDPEHEAVTADSVGLALLVVLETLAPAERLAFVLHDLFGVPFDEIAPIVGRSPTAARQLASRARRRVQGAAADPGLERDGDPETADVDRTRQREIVDAFLAASRGGDFAGLLAVLDPDVVFRADDAAVKGGTRVGIAAESRGATAVAGFFSRLGGNTAQLALIDGAAGSVWAPGGRPRAAFVFTVAHGKVVAIEMVVNPARLRQLEVTIL
jgi:RNA polymerase sigma-70 factor (ECF subfamily)